MNKGYFKRTDIGKVVEHGLGMMMTIVSLDPRADADSFYSSQFAYCRYKNEVSGTLEIGSFHVDEFKWPLEEEEEE